MTRKSTTRVNPNHLQPQQKYVCWIDIMGTRNTMNLSLARVSNFILKFHSCIIESKKKEQDIKYYPLMDGVFITCSDLNAMKRTLNTIFGKITDLFCNEETFEHKFIIRGSLAFGEVVDGCDISNDICKEINEDTPYRNTLLLGLPVAQAYENEHNAPPFGIYIHESARQFKNLQGRYYQWNNTENKISLLGKKLEEYFQECERQIYSINMNPDKIKVYMELQKECFPIKDSE